MLAECLLDDVLTGRPEMTGRSMRCADWPGVDTDPAILDHPVPGALGRDTS